MSTIKRPAAYLRLSVSADDSVSIEGQRRLILAECERRGWPEPVVLVDEGVSGSKDVRRPGRDELEARLAAGEFSALIVKSVDRLARSTADFARIAKVCKNTDTDLVVLDLGVDTASPGGAVVLSVMAALAEFEAQMVGSRVAQANEERTRQGKAIGGPVPYHLANRRTAEGTYRVIDEPKAAVAREAVERVLSGESLRAVAKDFNRRGIPTPRKGRAWSSSTIRQILENPAIAGMTRRLGDVVRGEDGLPRVDASTAIIDLDTWGRLSALLARRGTLYKPRTPEAERPLLDGLAKCASCGARMRRASSNRANLNYVCTHAARGSCIAPAAISVPLLDEYVVGEYLDRFGVFRVVEVDVQEAPEVAQERALLAAEAERLAQALASAEAADIAALAEQLTRVRAREAELRLAEPTIVTKDLGYTFDERWEAADLVERRALLADAIDAVVVGRGRGVGRVHILWRGEAPWRWLDGQDPAWLDD